MPVVRSRPTFEKLSLRGFRRQSGTLRLEKPFDDQLFFFDAVKYYTEPENVRCQVGVAQLPRQCDEHWRGERSAEVRPRSLMCAGTSVNIICDDPFVTDLGGD